MIVGYILVFYLPYQGQPCGDQNRNSVVAAATGRQHCMKVQDLSDAPSGPYSLHLKLI